MRCEHCERDDCPAKAPNSYSRADYSRSEVLEGKKICALNRIALAQERLAAAIEAHGLEERWERTT